MSRRVDDCGRPEADLRLAQARDYLELAELALEEKPQAAAGNAVLAAIAAADAICCFRLGQRSRGQDHREALSMLATVPDGGRQMAADLRRLLDIKDAAHYSATLMAQTSARSAVLRARRLFDAVRTAVGR